MCGILGLSLDNYGDVREELLEGLHLLQHRGQDACGIAMETRTKETFCFKGLGHVDDVFRPISSGLPIACRGIGHLRYGTTNRPGQGDESIQPIASGGDQKFFFVHNGHVTIKPGALARLGLSEDRLQSSSDSYLMSCILRHTIRKLGGQRECTAQQVFSAIQYLYLVCDGSFACALMVSGLGTFAFRDQHGIKPLIYGKRSTGPGTRPDWMFSSESVTLQSFGFGIERDVRPGEVVFFPVAGDYEDVTAFQACRPSSYTPDIFEYVYIARPESVIDGISVYRSRQLMGEALAREVLRTLGPEFVDSIDAVVAVPETSYVCAAAAAQILGKPYAHSIVKNPHVKRTFIVQGTHNRLAKVRRKFSFVAEEFRGRHILLVDDSIVRGTTSRHIVQMARQAGCARVTMASCSPPIMHPHIYGIDLADYDQLIASNRTLPEMKEYIRCDELVFVPYSGLIESCLAARSGDNSVAHFETGIYTGIYSTRTPEGRGCPENFISP